MSKLYLATIPNQAYCMGNHYSEDDWSSIGVGETQEEALDRLATIYGKGDVVGSYGGIDMYEVEAMIKNDKIYIALPFNDINTQKCYSWTRDTIIDSSIEIGCNLNQADLKEREAYKKAKQDMTLQQARMKVINQRKKIDSLDTERTGIAWRVNKAREAYKNETEDTLEYHEKGIEYHKLQKKLAKVLVSELTAQENLKKAKKVLERLENK